MVAGDDGWSELAQLYREHARSLVRLAALLVDDIGTAEEIVQDAFVLVHRRWAQVEKPEQYLRKSVVNLSRSRLRRRLVALRHPPAHVPDAPPVDELARGPGAVIDALHALPRRQREVLVLRYWSQLSEAEIAATLRISVGSVKTHAHRGLTTLQQRLEP
jgi:RNA polymerase sigma-70 factor (sigma-E family)